MTTIIIVIVALVIVREILAALLGWGSGEGERTVSEFMADRKHNAAIDRQWEKNGRHVDATTVGWRPNPNGGDGYKDDGYNGQLGGDGHTYSKRIR